MKYITSYYIPPLRIEDNPFLSRKYFTNALAAFENKEVLAPAVMGRVKNNQMLLGQEMFVFVESALKNNWIGKEILKNFYSIGLNIIELKQDLCQQGLFWKKCDVVKQALELFQEPVLWFDFTDVRFVEKPSLEELSFLNNGREVVAEFEMRRRFGACPHYKNGTENCSRYVRTPQNGIYYIRSIEFLDEVLKVSKARGIGDDQLGFAHVFENRYSLYQDSPEQDVTKFSSNGLFYSVHPKNNQTTYCFTGHFRYNKKILHKL